MSIQEKTDILLNEQAIDWPLLANNLKGQKSIKIKLFQFKNFTIKVQFNPKRIISSAAKVDEKSINERACFLCSGNRPIEQKELLIIDNYVLLCNPFPIFDKHFTISHTKHKPQNIKDSFSDFLDISKKLPHLVTFYNGPKCGASAPDHLHFQAGNKGFLPLEKDYSTLKKSIGNILTENDFLKAYTVNDNLRTFVAIESKEKNEIISLFSKIYHQLTNKQTEPMLNILSWYNKGWKVLVMLRGKHRPWQYFEEGESNILLSPASVDLGGVLITPLEKDFEKITKEDITDILSQVSLENKVFDEFITNLSNELQNNE